MLLETLESPKYIAIVLDLNSMRIMILNWNDTRTTVIILLQT